jgi:purine-cytosine permease-like protein
MWAGASLQIEYFVYGVILMTFGFTFAQAVAIIVLGNLSYLFLGLASLQGPQAGTTAMTINRASFGTRGSRLIALFNWLTQVGFETEGLILVVFAAEVLAVKAGFLPGTPAKVVFIVIAVAIQLLLPLLGHATMVKTLRLLIIPFVILFAILAALTLGKAHLNAVPHGAGCCSWSGSPSRSRWPASAGPRTATITPVTLPRTRRRARSSAGSSSGPRSRRSSS